MRYCELFEANLKLLPKELPRMRGSYAAFLITMHPDDFLKLTACPVDYARIEQKRFPETDDEFTRDGGKPEQLGRFPMPFLNVEWPTGRVLGHEGRHRALMVSRQGGTAYPVTIFLRATSQSVVTYQYYPEDSEEAVEGREVFDDPEAAYERRRHLEADMDYFRIRVERTGGGAIKGSPTQVDPNDPWNRKAYTAADMPKVLISQYSDAVQVSDFRVGLIKGYRHFR